MVQSKSSLLSLFLVYLSSTKGCTKKTCDAYKYDIKRFITQSPDKELEEITTKDIENYFNTERNRGLSLVTIARTRSSLKSFYRYLHRNNYIEDNPTALLDEIKIPRNEPSFLSEAECKMIINEAKTTTSYYQKRDTLIIQLFVYCGLRRSELTQLNVSDVELNKNSLKVTRKGGHKQLVPIPEKLMKSVRSYLNNKNDPSNPLFTSRLGNRISPEAIWRLVKKYAKLAGLDPSITVHSLRHSYATNLLRKKASLAHIQKLMGHADIKTTARYLHINNEELTKVVNSLV